jgi:hypothetical protein
VVSHYRSLYHFFFNLNTKCARHDLEKKGDDVIEIFLSSKVGGCFGSVVSVGIPVGGDYDDVVDIVVQCASTELMTVTNQSM